MSDSPDKNKSTRPARNKDVRVRTGARVQVDRELTPEEKKRLDEKVKAENKERANPERGPLKGHAALRADRDSRLI